MSSLQKQDCSNSREKGKFSFSHLALFPESVLRAKRQSPVRGRGAEQITGLSGDRLGFCYFLGLEQMKPTRDHKSQLDEGKQKEDPNVSGHLKLQSVFYYYAG